MSTRMRSLIAQLSGLSLAALLLLALTTTGLAQSDNTQITGTVKDATGAVISNAKVTVRSESKNTERTAVTNADGNYTIPQLPPDYYTVTIEAAGFKTYREVNKKLDPNVPARTDADLQPGQVSEVVNVTANSAAVQTETAAVGKLVEKAQIENIQLNGRNPLLLAVLKPGVIGGSLQSNNFGLTQGGLIINGARTQDTLITFDGAVGVRTRSNGTSIGVADLDSTQEIQILTANYTAEYGRSAGGQVRIVTKSGTNEFHGLAYEYLRNAALNANTWDRNRLRTAARPCEVEAFKKDDACRPNPFRYNQFGYNVSGPVWIPGLPFNKNRDKLFWLFSQEWVKQRATGNNIQRVPTAKMRTGDFSEITPGSGFFIPQLNVSRFIKDPLLPGACSATDQSGCFRDGGILGKIPANRVSKNGLALLNAFPLPVDGFYNSSGSNFFQSRPLRTDQRKENVNIDYIPNERHAIKGRLSLYHFVDLSAYRGATDRAPQIIDRPNQTLSIGWTWSISPTFISETLAAASRDQVFIYVDTAGDRYKRSIYGINYPYIFNSPKEIQDKIPTVDGLDIFGSLDGGPYPSSSKGPIYQLSQNFTKIKGNHTIKFGAYLERAGQNDFDQINVSGTPGGTNNQNGRFVFTNATAGGTGVAVGNAAIGLFDTYAEIGDRSYTPYRGHMIETFLQNSQKVTPKLKLEYGLRWSIIQPYYSLWRNMSVFDAASYNPALAVTQNPLNGFITSNPNDLRARYNGLVIPGDGWPDAAKGPGRIAIATTGQFDFLFKGSKEYSQINKDNFQPRVGLAYAFNDKTVFRSGVGRYITRLGVSDSVFLGGNPPFQPTVSISGGNVDNPGGSGGNVFPLVITTQDPIFKNPEAWTWNATFQREIGFNTTVEVSYVGRRGLHQQRERNLNQLQVGTCPASQPGFTGGCPFINPNNTAAGRFNVDYLRPYKGYGIIRVTNNDANSTYNSFQVGVDRRFYKGLLFGFAYTLSKSYDDGSAQRDVVPNAYDVSNLWGPSTFDRRHQVVINFAYELPIFRTNTGILGKTLGGWLLSGTSQMATGNPLTVATGDDFAGVGTGSGSQFWIFSQKPENVGKFASTTASTDYYFNPFGSGGAPIFTRPAPGTISNQRARGLFYGPGFQNHNLRLQKDFRITESQAIRFQAEAYNWLNHPNWSNPDTNPNNYATTFGKVTGKSAQRELQFALRYSF